MHGQLMVDPLDRDESFPLYQQERDDILHRSSAAQRLVAAYNEMEGVTVTRARAPFTPSLASACHQKQSRRQKLLARRRILSIASHCLTRPASLWCRAAVSGRSLAPYTTEPPSFHPKMRSRTSLIAHLHSTQTSWRSTRNSSVCADSMAQYS